VKLSCLRACTVGLALLTAAPLLAQTMTPTPVNTATLTPTPTGTPAATALADFPRGYSVSLMDVKFVRLTLGGAGPVTVVDVPPAGSRIYLVDVDAATTAATTAGGLKGGSTVVVPMEAAGAATFPYRAYVVALPLPLHTALTLAQTGSGTLSVNLHYFVAP
jgi:hypothetical protein